MATESADASTRPSTAEEAPLPPKLDLRLLDYLSPFDQNIACPICHCPFIEGERLPCDHTFCKECLHTAVRTQSSSRKTCPSCRSPVDISKTTSVPRFIRQMIDDLTVRCPTHSSGCSKQLRREDVHDHLNRYCEFVEITCPTDGCELMIQRATASSDRCLHHLVNCAACELEIMEKDLKTHEESLCKARSVTCEHCQASHPVSETNLHIVTCPDVTLSCDAASIGCKTILKRKDISKHHATCVLVSLMPTLQSMNQKIDEQRTTIDVLRRRNDILEGGMSSMQDLLANVPLPIENPSGNPSRHSAGSNTPGVPSEVFRDGNEAPFDSATHHLLSLHETLRYELDRLGASVAENDARLSMAMINNDLRIREEMTHQNAALTSMRMQLQWLTQARLQAQTQAASASNNPAANVIAAAKDIQNILRMPPRRLSDPSRQDTKL